MSPDLDVLRLVLERSRTLGLLGPGPVDPHITHAEGFGVSAEDNLGRIPDSFADLGTGGGIPGLVLGMRWPAARGILVEAGQRRCIFLREAVSELGIGDHVEVIEDRAEVVARSDDFREQFEVVTARSFASPAITAEIGAGLVKVGGVLVVSEPPERDDRRWHAGEVQALGFSSVQVNERPGAHFAGFRKESPVPTRYPRAVGRPAKRPLW